MALYKATKDGNIPRTREEEAKIIADWNREQKRRWKSVLQTWKESWPK